MLVRTYFGSLDLCKEANSLQCMRSQRTIVRARLLLLAVRVEAGVDEVSEL